MRGRKSPIHSKTKVSVALGKVIRAHRKRRNLSQEEFSELVGLSKNYIGNLERGEHQVTASTLYKITSALDEKASDWMREAGL